MKIVFFGTPEYVTPVVQKLHKSFESSEDNKSSIVAVVTQAPRPVGRKQILTYSPVDKWAYEKDLLILNESRKVLELSTKPDVGVLASYGEIIPKEVLEAFPHGILNIHPSLLPKYRGATPIRAAMVAGDSVTGVSIIKLDEKLDHGKIVSQFKVDIEEDDTVRTLQDKLFHQAADALVELMNPYLKGKINLKTQNEEEVSYCSQIKKADGFIKPEYIHLAIQGKTSKEKWSIPFIKEGLKKNDFEISPSPRNINNYIKAMNPWPMAWTLVKLDSKKDSKRLRILESHVSENKLLLEKVQLEGKNEVSWKQFKEGYPTVTFL